MKKSIGNYSRLYINPFLGYLKGSYSDLKALMLRWSGLKFGI